MGGNRRKTVPRGAKQNRRTSRSVPEQARFQPERNFLVFRFDAVDLDKECPWALFNATNEDHRLILKTLFEYERKTPAEIRPDGEHFKYYRNFGECPNRDAAKRLAEKYEGRDSIARIRLTGEKRLYGFLEGNEFHVVWWDPKHNIWPSQKK